MNTSGEIADLMVKESIQITEAALKLTGLGAKNLAAIVVALLNEDNKLQGKTSMKKLLKEDKPLSIMQIKTEDLKKFNVEAKKYGVLYTAVTDKDKESKFCDIIAKQDDVTKLNYIMEKMGYPAPEVEDEKEPEAENEQEETEKKHNSRADKNQQKNESTKHGDMGRTDNNTNGKSSVKDKVEEIKANEPKKEPKKQKSQTHTSQSTKKRKSKSKGKNK